jgi:type II secretory pathway predicted ATPase ExeA
MLCGLRRKHRHLTNSPKEAKKLTYTTYAIDKLTTAAVCAHWGFSSLPFPKNIPPAEVLLLDHFQHTLARLQQLLCTREIGVVTGEAGTGKTALIEVFLSQVTATRHRVIHIKFPPAKARELYRAISTALGVNTSLFGADAMKVVDLLTFSFVESNRPNLLVIDEAQLLTPTCLNELRLLTNTMVRHEPIVTLLLFGQPALSTTLKSPALIPVTGRIGVWANMKGLTEEETIAYIDWQTVRVGGQKEIFTSAAKTAIFRRSQGMPRLINRFALECLNQGCLDEAKVVTEELLAYVCKKIGPHLNN